MTTTDARKRNIDNQEQAMRTKPADPSSVYLSRVTDQLDQIVTLLEPVGPAVRTSLTKAGFRDATTARYEREDTEARQDDPDETLAKAICESLDFRESSMLGEAVTAAVKDVLAAGWFPGVGRDKWQAEANRLRDERDGWKAKHAAIRADFQQLLEAGND